MPSRTGTSCATDHGRLGRTGLTITAKVGHDEQREASEYGEGGELHIPDDEQAEGERGGDDDSCPRRSVRCDEA
jgi:hypothetical protein